MLVVLRLPDRTSGTSTDLWASSRTLWLIRDPEASTCIETHLLLAAQTLQMRRARPRPYMFMAAVLFRVWSHSVMYHDSGLLGTDGVLPAQPADCCEIGEILPSQEGLLANGHGHENVVGYNEEEHVD